MATISVTWANASGLKLFDAALKSLGDKRAQRAYSMALNKTAGKVHTQIKRTVAKQMGVTQGTVIKRGSLKIVKAFPGKLVASVDGSGKHLPLKDFKPAQRKKGASANPWGTRRIFPGTFMTVTGKAGGHVFRNTGKFSPKSGRFNGIEKLWGPAVPKEMVKDESERAFHRIASSQMPIEIERAIKVLTKGVVS